MNAAVSTVCVSLLQALYTDLLHRFAYNKKYIRRLTIGLFPIELSNIGLVYTSRSCRTFVASNVIQTIDNNEMSYLIICCLNRI